MTPNDIIIIIMEIRKAPTSRFQALNKRNLTHIMYIEMNIFVSKLNKTNTSCGHQHRFKHTYLRDARNAARYNTTQGNVILYNKYNTVQDDVVPLIGNGHLTRTGRNKT